MEQSTENYYIFVRNDQRLVEGINSNLLFQPISTISYGPFLTIHNMMQLGVFGKYSSQFSKPSQADFLTESHGTSVQQQKKTTTNIFDILSYLYDKKDNRITRIISARIRSLQDTALRSRFIARRCWSCLRGGGDRDCLHDSSSNRGRHRWYRCFDAFSSPTPSQYDLRYSYIQVPKTGCIGTVTKVSVA